MPRERTNAVDVKGRSVGNMGRLLEDDRRHLSRCQSGRQQFENRSPSLFYNTMDSRETSPGLGSQVDCASSSSPLWALDQPLALASVQNVLVASSDESGSDVDIDDGSKLVSDDCGLLKATDWGNLPVLSRVEKLDGRRDDALITKSVYSSKRRGVIKNPLSWRDRCMGQLPRLHDSSTKNIVDRYPRRVSTSYEAQRAYRKGSSSKAPQTNDLTASSLLEKKSGSIAHKALLGEGKDPVFAGNGALYSKIRSTAGRQNSHSTNSGLEGSNRGKGNYRSSDGNHANSEKIVAGYKNMNSNGSGLGRRSLTNLGCTSAADVLPSVSGYTLSNTSAVDVLPFIPSSEIGSGNLHSRRSLKPVGLEEETNRRRQPLKLQGEEAEVLRTRGLQYGTDQAPFWSAQGVSHSRRAPCSHSSQAAHLGVDFVSSCETSTTSSTSLSSPLLPSNDRRWGRNGSLSSTGDGLRTLCRSSSSFSEANCPCGEESSNEWSTRRSLYGSRTDPMCPDRRSFHRNSSHRRHSSNTWSILREMHYPHSRFPGPPVRPPPLPSGTAFADLIPLETAFNHSHPTSGAHYSSQTSTVVSPSPNTDQQPSSAALPEIGLLNRTRSIGEGRSRLTVEGLSEILSALESIERNEDLSYEQILMLEATVILGGIGLHDRYRDMRIDIDNMSYEELLALEERIGNVNTGLPEESVRKAVRVKAFVSPVATCDYVPQDIEIKCSICQEEFEEPVELGILDCGHSHHIACIKQWLLQKNQCPICKAAAMP